jgi:hypothetical protein
MELVNLTPYAADTAITMDGTGTELLLVVVKATFLLTDGAPALAPEQAPPVSADAYAGEPDASSLVQATETTLYKPAADVVVQGSAFPPRGRGSEALVALEIGPIRKIIRVVGDRRWKNARGVDMSTPEPFVEMPLTYERAFGGRDASASPPEAWPKNPVGVGFRGKGSRAPVAGTPLPNLEDPQRPTSRATDRLPARAFGPIAPSWSPRVAYAGTYDAVWQRNRMPFPPVDFDARFHQVAPADQVLAGYLTGGEGVGLTGMRAGGGAYRFTLPALAPEVVVRVDGERVTPAVRCDTLAIDARAQTFSLLARATVRVHGRVPAIEWIKVQERACA